VHISRTVAVATVAAVATAGFGASDATASRISPRQAAHLRAELKREIHRNPRVVRSRSFVRKASLVNFVLPVTIRLRNPCLPGTGGVGTCANDGGSALNENANYMASLDFGPSLGRRDIALGGSLAGEIQFHDSYDGGALGNVDIKLLPSSTKFLQTSSVPLLWNPDVSDPATRSDANVIAAEQKTGGYGLSASGLRQGCGDFLSTAPANTPAVPPSLVGYNALFKGFTPTGSTFGAGNGFPGYPYYAAPGSTTPAGYLPINPGVDALDQLQSGYTVGNNDFIGPNPDPFPAPAGVRPGGMTHNAADTVLRTNALQLTLADPGTAVDMATGTPISPNTLPTGQGSQNIVTGLSGGQANLFGNIPGKSSSIDVTVNLATTINTIARITDQDVFNLPMYSGDQYPAYYFNCRQVWLGAVRNYIPGLRLTGNLRISPGITKDGKLRIAKATISTPQPDHLALSACLMPYSSYDDYNDPISNAVTTPPIPAPGAIGTPSQLPGGGGVWPATSDVLPVFTNAEQYPPGSLVYNTVLGSNAPSIAPCNSTPYALIRNAGLTGPVDPLTPASAGDGYTTTASGSQVTVAGDISVPPLNIDVIIGDA